jgi:hypothetical protein
MEILSHGMGEPRSERVFASKLVFEPCRCHTTRLLATGNFTGNGASFGKISKLTEQVVTEMVGEFIIKKWKRQGICLW